jgi:hypothetical protein
MAGDGMVGEYGSAKKKRKKGKRELSELELDERMLVSEGKAHIGRPFKSLAERDKWVRDGALVSGGTTRRKKAKRKAPSGAKRKAPTGGLNLKALSASWKKAGKPGTWQGWIRDNK